MEEAREDDGSSAGPKVLPDEATALLPASGSKESWMPRITCTPRMVTFSLLCLASALALGDHDISGPLLRTYEIEFDTTAGEESVILLSEGLAFALASPIWGVLADLHSRKLLMVIGACIWGVSTIITATSQSIGMLCAFRALSGIGLAAIMPIGQGLVADLVEAKNRGLGYGTVNFVGGLGRAIINVVTTNVGSLLMFGGRARAWRFVVGFIGTLSLVLAAVIHYVMPEPERSYQHPAKRKGKEGQEGQEDKEYCGGTLHVFRTMCTVPTFLLVTLQGIFGQIPWSAIQGFAVLWLQYSGISNGGASVALITFLIGDGIGVLFGGWLGDKVAREYPEFGGRPRVAQISVLCGILMSAIIFAGISPTPHNLGGYCACLFILGFTASWCGSGVNQPILSEIVPPHMRASTMATEYGLELASASVLGGPVVGIIADALGYRPSRAVIADMPTAVRARNEEALRRALLYLVLIPWAICFLCYLLVAHTYVKDREKAVERARVYQETVAKASQGDAAKKGDSSSSDRKVVKEP